jgi:pimeloyl-ACP methyl ester carboxylesterase
MNVVCLCAAAIACDTSAEGQPFETGGGAGMEGMEGMEGENTVVPRCFQGTAARAERHADGSLIVTLGDGPTGVVLAPISWGDACEWSAVARWLVSRGYRIATFSWGSRRESTLQSAFQSLQTGAATAPKKTVLIGGCMGATVALALAHRMTPVPDAVVAVSPVPNLGGVSIYPGIERYAAPLLLLGTKDDPLSTPAMLKEIAQAHSGPHRLELWPGTAHAAEIFQGPDAERARKLLVEFLHSALGRPPQPATGTRP